MRCVHKIAVIIGVCSTFMVKYFSCENLYVVSKHQEVFAKNIGNENIFRKYISFHREMNMFSNKPGKLIKFGSRKT